MVITNARQVRLRTGDGGVIPAPLIAIISGVSRRRAAAIVVRTDTQLRIVSRFPKFQKLVRRVRFMKKIAIRPVFRNAPAGAEIRLPAGF